MAKHRSLLHQLRQPRSMGWLLVAAVFLLSLPSFLSGLEAAYFVVFAASLLLLLKSADFLVGGSSRLASYLGVTPMLIGITVVAFGTSAPELMVSSIANLFGFSDMSVGNVVGSNISNICLVLGLAAILVPITERRNIYRFDIPFLIGVSLLLPLTALNLFMEGPSAFVIGLADGLILLALFGYFITYQARKAKQYCKENPRSRVCRARPERDRSRLISHLVPISAGIAGVVVFAAFLVDSARGIAAMFSVPDAIIGLTLLAIGTSLPELATNLVAALKDKLDLAVGNVIGSNIFNILLVLGVTSVISPIGVVRDYVVLVDIPVMISVTFLMVVLFRMGHCIRRRDGLILVAVYAVYVAQLFTRL